MSVLQHVKVLDAYTISLMDIVTTALEGVVVVEPRILSGSRGYFFESFSQEEFDKKVRPIRFVQDNESKSSYGAMKPSSNTNVMNFMLHRVKVLFNFWLPT